MLHREAPELSQGDIDLPKQTVSPVRPSLEAPLTGSSPLQQSGHACLEVTPSATHSGAATRFFAERDASRTLNFAHLAAIANEGMLFKLRQLGFYTKASLTDARNLTITEFRW